MTTSTHPEIHGERTSAAFGAWFNNIGPVAVTVSDVIAHASGLTAEPALNRALLAVASDGTGFISATGLAKWLQAHAGRIVEGYLLTQSGTHNGVALWTLVQMA